MSILGLPSQFTDDWHRINNLGADNSDGMAIKSVPTQPLTVDEQEEINAILGPVNTYVVEQMTALIVGDRPISEIDDFMKCIAAAGVLWNPA